MAQKFAFLLTWFPDRRRLPTYRALILLAVWSLDAYRYIFPLATYDRTPLDVIEGKILWANSVVLYEYTS